MGGAQSSNVTDVATNIGNTIQNSTYVNQDQITAVTRKINFYNCDMNSTNGAFAATIYGTTKLRQGQMDNVQGSNTLSNNVAQSAIQSATSKVGSLGIGYANASNAVNMLCNVTNNVISKVSANETQIATSSNNITCNNTRINVRGNITFSITDSVELVQTMVLKNSQINDISNSVSQSVKQTASATVEGIAGALIAIAILIVAIGWSFGEVVTSSTSFLKPLITIGVAVLIGFIVFLAWFNSWGPFFSKLTPCSNATKIGNGSSFSQGSGIAQQPELCEQCLIEDKSPQLITLKSCPIKYIFPVIDADSLSNDWTINVKIRNENLNNSCLFDIAAISGSQNQKNGQSGTYNNAGYTIASLNYTNVALAKFNTLLKSFSDLGIKNPIIKEMVTLVQTTYPIPPLLIDPSGSISSGSTALDTSTMKFITIPAQNQIVLQNTIPSEYDSLTGVCTPSPFVWDKSVLLRDGDWTSWGMQQSDPQKGNCHQVGSYSLKGTNKNLLLTSDPQYGLANNNKTAFAGWMLKLSDALSTSPAVNNDKSTAENAVCGFARTLLVFIINQWLLEIGQTGIEGSAYIFPFEVLIITPPVGSSGKDNTFLTEIGATTLPPIMKGLDFSQYTMNYIPSQGTVYNLMSSMPANSGGKVKMVQGVCKNKTYELQRFMSTVGNWILLFIILVALVVIWRA